MPDLVESMKKAAMGAYEASSPTALMFGKVISTSPLQINVEQRLTLTEKQLVLTRTVKGFSLGISGRTGSGGNPAHSHSIGGSTNQTSLNVGDSVLLCRMSGGQQFVVLDWVVD